MACSSAVCACSSAWVLPLPACRGCGRAQAHGHNAASAPQPSGWRSAAGAQVFQSRGRPRFLCGVWGSGCMWPVGWSLGWPTAGASWGYRLGVPAGADGSGCQLVAGCGSCCVGRGGCQGAPAGATGWGFQRRSAARKGGCTGGSSWWWRSWGPPMWVRMWPYGASASW